MRFPHTNLYQAYAGKPRRDDASARHTNGHRHGHGHGDRDRDRGTETQAKAQGQAKGKTQTEAQGPFMIAVSDACSGWPRSFVGPRGLRLSALTPSPCGGAK
mgnify:CR=1 FL=1